MKLEERVEQIRLLIWKAFDKRLQRLGLMEKNQYDHGKVPLENLDERKRLDDILVNLEGETGDYFHARKKLIDELCFTFFNRVAGVKVMEVHDLIHPIFTRDEIHGGRSFGHKRWLEEHPDEKNNLREGLQEYIKAEFETLAYRIQLYSPDYLYSMLPDVNDLNEIIDEFNQISEEDWYSDDIMGWMYEYYNRTKREEFKSSGEKIEYQWVSLTSQVYTPRWVVEFILNNSLGKLWMEMHPESSLKDHYDIANIPDESTLDIKPIEDIKVLDPAVGSGNFLLYAFDLFYELYLEEGETPETDIPQKIIENNIFGIDLDDRAIQIAQLGLYIKALKHNSNTRIDHTNVVSADFYLPEYDEISEIFRKLKLHQDARDLLRYIWDDLRLAHKFGSLIRIEERIIPIIEKYKRQGQMSLMQVSDVDLLEQWEKTVIPAIKNAMEKYTTNGRSSGAFFKTKTLDSLNFVEILRNKFDVIVANPPYTDSANYGVELKAFMLTNYKKPMAFNNNLYGACLKRATELINSDGKIGFVNPPTFMYIKTFEDMRKHMINNYHIHLFVEWGYLGMFTPTARVDSAIYILENKNITGDTTFIKLNDLYETKRKNALFKAFKCHLNEEEHLLLYHLDQSKLKLIKSWPFIYWISDAFREKFGSDSIDNQFYAVTGLMTGKNIRFLRYHWEVNQSDLSEYYPKDKRKWVPYQKGGDFNKWFGNNWITVNFENNGQKLATTDNSKFYFNEGITYSASGSKGVSFRWLNGNSVFDKGGSCIFPKKYFNVYYTLGFLNSKLSFYTADCLNPTVNIQVGDIKRIPFAKPPTDLGDMVSQLAEENVAIRKHLCHFSIFEMNYKHHPLMWAKEKTDFNDLKKLIKTFLDSKNEQLAKVFVNEAEIDELIFEVYQLSDEDKQMVLEKEGEPIGSFNNEVHQETQEEIEDLYQQNHSLEEICEKVKVNPILVAKLLKQSNVLPERRISAVATDFLFDMVREVLTDDDDGIIPLVEFAGETTLQKRLFDKLVEKGFSPAQISNYRDILGKDINDYLLKGFFVDLCDRLNLFQHLPKTPFIWHLSAGELGSFEAFVLIYKWSRDKMYRLRSVYVEKRESSLRNRFIDIRGDDSFQAQNEKALILNQLVEIAEFKQKIDEILQSGYDPRLDGGVGKNIAPLQEKGLLKIEVLKEKQLKKYLEADW